MGTRDNGHSGQWALGTKHLGQGTWDRALGLQDYGLGTRYFDSRTYGNPLRQQNMRHWGLNSCFAGILSGRNSCLAGILSGRNSCLAGILSGRNSGLHWALHWLCTALALHTTSENSHAHRKTKIPVEQESANLPPISKFGLIFAEFAERSLSGL